MPTKNTKKKKATSSRHKPVKKRRLRATFNKKDGTIVYPAHPAGEGYDIHMIRDFHEQLLLELRCAQAISVQEGRTLKEKKNFIVAGRALDCPGDSEVDQFHEYFDKYKSMLVFPEEFDRSGVTPEEATAVMRLWYEEDILRRDEQIGRLEAVQDLLADALHCAKVNYGLRATKKVRLLEFLPKPIEVPAFETLQESFDDHSLGSEESIEAIKTFEVMTALILPDGQSFIVFGREEVREANREGLSVLARTFSIRNRDELQFLLSAFVKYRGRHDFCFDLDSPFEV